MNKKQQLIPVFLPDYGKEEIKAVTEVLKSGWIGIGPKTDEFEKKFALYVNSPYAVAVNSATSALHLALLAAGIGQGDEVILPSMTFVSTAHVIQYVGATPVFSDIDPDTLCISPKDVVKRITKKTRAIIPVHYGGNPCDLKSLQEIADANNSILIEDAAHACGSVYHGKMIGSISPFTCFSFHAVKNLATGDGGMITVKNAAIANRLRRLRWMGITKDTWKRLEDISVDGKKKYREYSWYYEVSELGYKYHMNDINAALGIAQLAKLEKSNQKRRLLSAYYSKKLAEIKEIICPMDIPDVTTSQHNYVIRCEQRDKMHLYLRKHNISSGVHYFPIHLQPFYKQSYPNVSLPITETQWQKLLTLPLYPTLTKKQQDYIILSIKNFYQCNRKK